jgi:hypothetical protein
LAIAFPKEPVSKLRFFFFHAFSGFHRLTKENGLPTAYIGYCRKVIIIRQKRDLAEKVWYRVETTINVGEPLFKLLWTEVIFCCVLIEAKKRFDFEMRGLVIGNEWLSFYIKPADGYQLPKILRWMKQPPRSFSVSASFQIMKQIYHTLKKREVVSAFQD